MNPMLIRGLSGSVYVVLILLFSQWGAYPWAAFAAVLLILGLVEWNGLGRAIGNEPPFIWSIMPLGLFTALFLTFTGISNGLIPALLALVIPGLLLIQRPEESALNELGGVLMSAAYLAVPLGISIGIRQFPGLEQGPLILLSIFIFLWCNDTFAYLIGKWLGSMPLAPNVSPRKTVEGTLGGMLFCLIAALILSNFHTELDSIDLLALALIVSIMGTLGDLFESKIKRIAQVKDSGWIFPGHGGVLDRIDSFLFAAPVVYIYLLWVHG
jgi:phosphatidate cytidylyltransferase